MTRLPRTFEDFGGFHAGESVLVCGCGSSLRSVISPEQYLTIGVNDVGRLFQPDYLVVLNPREQFAEGRFRFVEASQAQAIFTQLDLGITHPRVIRFELGSYAGTDVSRAGLPHTRNSPYVAICLAMWMGATRIGVIGVDFTDHHFFEDSGAHPLSLRLPVIDAEYTALARACRLRGVEVFNLSAESRITAFPRMSPERFAALAAVRPSRAAAVRDARVFFVHYQFLSAGHVFRRGLERAAGDLGIMFDSADWNDPDLPSRVRQFAPDLMLVVHGRRFASKWGDAFDDLNTAVWLVDEPYEVDDSSAYARHFRTVFVNDASTLHRHRNAAYLPVCFDPHAHWCSPAGPRRLATGFVGGANPAREAMLGALADRGLLTYVVGGPFRDGKLAALSRARNISCEQTAALYRDTRAVINVFRSQHHFNRSNLPARSLNPRIYEAAACGALVISEARPELSELCPETPSFSNGKELVELALSAAEDPERFEGARRRSMRRLAGHTYADRLLSVLERTMELRRYPPPAQAVQTRTLDAEWRLPADVNAVQPCAGEFRMETNREFAPGSEAGLIGANRHADVALSFELSAPGESCFIAKIHQQEAADQLTNSYHVVIEGARVYLARHHHVFCRAAVEPADWRHVCLTWFRGLLALHLDGKQICAVRDSLLQSGYSFVGVKRGTVRVRNLRIGAANAKVMKDQWQSLGFDILYDRSREAIPDVSIVTTVYDRVGLLENCIRSVNRLSLDNYEHTIVADGPPPEVQRQIETCVAAADGGIGSRTLVCLAGRRNDWGISPAAAGLTLAAGRYVAFLSDDNGYTSNHFEALVRALDRDPNLGFAYSSCQYAGRSVLNYSPPRFGRIDLGQPLFRTAVLRRHLNGTLPFQESAWDWRMIELLLRRGVRWMHVDRPTFVFRLHEYPELVKSLR